MGFLKPFFKNNVVFVSGVQQNDSLIHYLSVIKYPSSDSFPLSLLQDIEYNSLCYTVGPCCLSILHIAVCVC